MEQNIEPWQVQLASDTQRYVRFRHVLLDTIVEVPKPYSERSLYVHIRQPEGPPKATNARQFAKDYEPALPKEAPIITAQSIVAAYKNPKTKSNWHTFGPQLNPNKLAIRRWDATKNRWQTDLVDIAGIIAELIERHERLRINELHTLRHSFRQPRLATQ